MALTYEEAPNAIPIVKIKGSKKIIYLVEDDDTFVEIPTQNIEAHKYICPYCKNILSTKNRFIYHIKICEKSSQSVNNMYAKINTNKQYPLQKIPSNNHEVLFVTGIPGSGKTYWTNEYVKAYKKLYGNYVKAYKKLYGNKVYLFSTHDKDETIGKDDKNYISIDVTDELLKEPFELKDFENSLVIFDDIESSKYPKATKYLLSLMEDIAKNGRHYHISEIYINQECRSGKITKKILTLMTGLVFFPSGETYQTQRLLMDYCGMSKRRAFEIMNMKTRWVYFSRARPQYIITEHSCFILGKEAYGVNK